jgi:hypothetical protein
LKLLKAATKVLTEEDLPPDWQIQIESATKQIRRPACSIAASPELITRAQHYVANCDGVREGGRNKKAFKRLANPASILPVSLPRLRLPTDTD